MFCYFLSSGLELLCCLGFVETKPNQTKQEDTLSVSAGHRYRQASRHAGRQAGRQADPSPLEGRLGRPWNSPVLRAPPTPQPAPAHAVLSQRSALIGTKPNRPKPNQTKPHQSKQTERQTDRQTTRYCPHPGRRWGGGREQKWGGSKKRRSNMGVKSPPLPRLLPRRRWW